MEHNTDDRNLWPRSDGIYERHTLTIPIDAEQNVLTRLAKLSAVVTDVSEVIIGHSAIEYWKRRK